jgi:hypothetical protein
MITRFRIRFHNLKMKNSILLLGFQAFIPLFLYSQDLNKVQSLIIKQDELFYKHQIPKKYRRNYKSVVQYLKDVVPLVFMAVKKTDPDFFNHIDSFNIVQSYNPNATALFGIIWKGKDSVYFYNFDWGSHVKIEKLSSHSLDPISRKIVKDLGCADCPFFSHIDADMQTAVDGSYYIANKCHISLRPEISTWAFYD